MAHALQARRNHMSTSTQGPETSWVRWGRAKDVLLSISCPLRKRFKSLVSARAFSQIKARSASYRQGASGCGVVSGVGNVTSCGLGKSLSLLLQLLPLRSSSPPFFFSLCLPFLLFYPHLPHPLATALLLSATAMLIYSAVRVSASHVWNPKWASSFGISGCSSEKRICRRELL